ncbi:XdhC family protein [Catenuloplanes japonicus]|uniref:XdhC family protein n=1 Tax=Catenuloplanes japonicus TaxID=33876 RepID=UPI0005254D61|nr:XdhC/CoxI family protein [Catenuloplanes japonicus]
MNADLLDSLLQAWSAGERAGLATVTATWASAPRRPGAAMLVRADGSVVGSVSGGCVEGAAYELCREAAEGGPPGTARFGVSDDDAFEVGLPCGGTLELFVEPAGFPELPALAAHVTAGRPVALLTCIEGPPDLLGTHLVLTADERTGSLGQQRLDDAATADGRRMLEAGKTGQLEYGSDVRVLVTAFVPAARMIVFGATDHAAAVAGIGTFLGYRVTVCDARPVFTTAERFAAADEVVVAWPHRYLTAEVSAGRVDARTVLCVLTHDPKFDVPVLDVALRLPVAYVGAMGSRRTHDDRLRRLADTGVDPGRLASPIGLDLGGSTPQETAVSIAAEIIALARGGTGRRLRDVAGPIHA